MEMLVEARGWIKFVGWLEIIGGVLIVFTEFPLGIISGGLSFVAGIFLIGAASGIASRDKMAMGENLRKYFMLHGAVALIGIVIVILAALGFGLISVAN